MRDLFAGEFGSIAEDDSERVSSHVGAIAVARSSGSSSALDALLGFNLIRKGGVLISLIDALVRYSGGAHPGQGTSARPSRSSGESDLLRDSRNTGKYRRGGGAG